MDKTGIGDRMKCYESVSDGYLMCKTPVIVRVDGKSFHTYTRGMEKPVCEGLVSTMLATATGLCESLSGARLAYVQSDEISVFLADWSKLGTNPWFDYRTQKVASVSASLATAVFNQKRSEQFFKMREEWKAGHSLPDALFDSRAFNLPFHEVINYFIWRQQDATRNSIASLAQSQFSHKQLLGKNSSEMQDMLMLEKTINWNDCETGHKRGYCVTRIEDQETGRSKWVVDKQTPIFTQDRAYIQSLVDQGVL